MGGLISGGAYIRGGAYKWGGGGGGGGGGGVITDVFYCFQVDGPITGGAYKRGAYNQNFTVVAVIQLQVRDYIYTEHSVNTVPCHGLCYISGAQHIITFYISICFSISLSTVYTTSF